MSETMLLEIVLAVLGGLFSIIGFLLHQKDAAQERSIELLFKKHDSDVVALQELKERIAGKHYERGELDVKFDRLESALRQGMDDLGTKFDHLSSTLIDLLKK